MANPHCCPRIMVSRRYGSWVNCFCGWMSPTFENPASASAAWADHVTNETEER